MTKSEASEVGLRLKARRASLGWTQGEAAEKLEISQKYYGSIENGKKDFSKDLLLRIVKIFDVSADFLLFGKPDHEINDKRIKAINNLPLQKQKYVHRIVDDLLDVLNLE